MKKSSINVIIHFLNHLALFRNSEVNQCNLTSVVVMMCNLMKTSVIVPLIHFAFLRSEDLENLDLVPTECFVNKVRNNHEYVLKNLHFSEKFPKFSFSRKY